MNRNGLLVALILTIMGLFSNNLYAAQVLFSPELRLSEEYTDNLFLTYQDTEADFITTAGLGLDLQILGQTSGLELIYNPSYSAFTDNPDMDYWRYYARGRAWKDFKRTRLELVNDYLETEDPRDPSEDFTPDDLTAAPLIDLDLTSRGRNRYRRNATTLSLTNQFGANDSIYLAMQHGYRENLDIVIGEPVSDYTFWQPSGEAGYWATRRLGVELEGYYSVRDYEYFTDRNELNAAIRFLYAFNSALSSFVEGRYTYLDYAGSRNSDYEIYSPLAGFRYQFEQEANISVAVGYYIQDYKAPYRENEEGLHVDSEIYKRWRFSQNHITLVGGSGYEIEDMGTQDLGLNLYYTMRMEIDHDFSRRVTGSIFGGYLHDDYVNENRIDKTITAGAQLSCQAFSWMNIDLRYEYTDLISDAELEQYTENSVILIFTLGPAIPYRWSQ
ncbi:MAG: outer membrane beta-barrel protein [Desulfobacteraceae bacterium]|nr:outer membrane beta-barrel protein [Desulfobacteraceae bacterium]